MINKKPFLLSVFIPTTLGNTLFYTFFQKEKGTSIKEKYKVKFKLKRGELAIDNIKRGASVIGAAGSGKQKVSSIIFYSILASIHFVTSYMIIKILN